MIPEQPTNLSLSLSQDAELLLSRYKAVMRSILEDSRLVQLQQEGGASLSRLRREESGFGVTEDHRAAVETVSALYDEVDELLHRLVTLSNSRTQELHFILEFRSLEQGFTEVSLSTLSARTHLRPVQEGFMRRVNVTVQMFRLIFVLLSENEHVPQLRPLPPLCSNGFQRIFSDI